MWRLAEPARFYARDEAVFVLYLVSSGDTHLLSATVLPLLKSLSEKPQSFAALLESLQRTDGKSPPIAEAELQQQLDALHSAACVTQV